MNIKVRITATGQVLTLDVEEYLKGVVPNESPASWPMEELKAQAVAARTYALASTGILADDERSQVYRPNSANPRTDEAIRLTHSIVGKYQGQIKPMFFSASCGGVTLGTWGAWLKHLDNCPCKAAGYVKNGHQQGMCQVGGKILASQGKTYQEILDTYYNMTFSPLNDTVTSPNTASKLSVHWQVIPAWGNQIHTPWQKVVDPGKDDTWPGTKTIGRLWLDNDNQINQQYIALGAVGADAYFARCLPKFRESPWVWVWEFANEGQPMSDLAFVKAYAAYSSRMVDLMRGAGLKSCVGSFGVTWPRVDQIVLFRDALQKADYWSVHEYSAPTMQSDVGNNCLHYRKLIGALHDANIHVPPLILSEVGIDCGVIPGGGGKGWLTCNISREQYEQQLAWYDSELMKDTDVVTATVFTGGPKSEWLSFCVDEVLARWIASRYQVIGGNELEDFLGAEAQKTIVPLNPNSAFEKYAAVRGWLPAGKGFDVVFRGVSYSVQPYRTPADRSIQYIIWSVTNDWGNVHHFIRNN